MFTTGEELSNAVLIWTIDYYTLINSTGQIYAFDWRPIHDVCFMKNFLLNNVYVVMLFVKQIT